LKGAIESIFQSFIVEEKINFVPSKIKELHLYQSADILLNQEKIGFLGQIHPQVSKKYQINQPVFGTQISLSKLLFFLEKNIQ